MDVLWFLEERTSFILRFYDEASKPFERIKQNIESGDAPYTPYYSEDGEPQYLEEWMDADTSVDVLGSLCISMLSESLKLYLNTWDKIIGTRCGLQLSAEFRKQGFIAGFKTCFGHYLRLDWDECPADFAILEQIVLARNDAQHASRIDEMRPTLSHKWREKHPRPIFMSDYERQIFSEDDSEVGWNDPCLIVSRENLETAIGQVNLLAEWLEPKLHDFKHRPR